MSNLVFSSKLIEDAVTVFSKLPGIGKKTALRMVLHLLKEDKETVAMFTNTVNKMRNETCFCPECNNISDGALCGICADSYRDTTVMCIVESIKDIIAIESTRQYNGLYHVIGGLLSPLDGIGPEQLHISHLPLRIQQNAFKEIIMALNPTIEGDTTIYYISKLLKDIPVSITTIARGVSFGGELEYTDELTLARSIAKRLPVDNYVKVDQKNDI